MLYVISSEIWDNFEISRSVFMPNITTNHAIKCLYYYPQKVCNFHMQVFQIKLKSLHEKLDLHQIYLVQKSAN